MDGYINCLESEIKTLVKEYKRLKKNISEGQPDNRNLLKIKRQIREIATTPQTPSFLNEEDLSRIHQHVTQNPELDWAILSPERGEHTLRQKKARHAILKRGLRRRGYGYMPLRGAWPECQDSTIPYEECPEEKLVDVFEKSYFVYGIPGDEAHKLGNIFKQDTVITGGPSSGNQTLLRFRKGNTEELGEFHPDVVAANYSRVRSGRTFAFAAKDDVTPRDTTEKETHRSDKEATSRRKSQSKTEFRKKAQDFRDHTIISSVSGNEIKISTALRPGHPDRQKAIDYVSRALGRPTGKDQPPPPKGGGISPPPKKKIANWPWLGTDTPLPPVQNARLPIK